ncbi:hypothetical protein FXW07_05890 [Methanosarcina sp. DH1]|uniref:hypothetical protein n=1 Tax=Methanosarcina sp. DH1 TaxID=2605695 RepID=UPI001E29D017|nr:hypothetical protein [Methanosarcina sp. DH1]MCC4766157.1 hypothetical protein [Methanosarcina sp. DH1]
MRFKILAAAMLILLGIVVFSVYSGSSNEGIPDDKEIIQKIEVNNSNFFEVSEDWDGFEAVVIDTDEFRKDADKGNVTLKLMGENFKIRIQKASRINGENEYYYYTGQIIGSKEGTSDLYVDGEYLYGSVEPGEPWNVTYNIAHTDKRYNGKIVHVIFMQDWEKEKERLEKMEIDPLQFFLTNSDFKKHVMSIEIFDFNNKSVFKENYTIDPEEKISSPKINAEMGQYRYEMILDNKFTFEQKIQADYAADVSSSETLDIYISDDPENPVTFGITVA